MFLRKNTPFAVLLLVSALARFAPAADFSPEDRFRGSVWPLLEDACLRCHGAEKQKGDLRLDSREAALKGGKNGPALVPGHPEESLLLRLVKHEDEDRHMPPADDLSEAQTKIFEQWIAEGAVWPGRSAAPAMDPGKRIGNAWSDPQNPIVQIFGGQRLDLWSLKPLSHPIPPAVRQANWIANPVDAFVLAALEAKGLHPAPEADRRKQARRLWIDLTGLPPTPEELSHYLADESPDAYGRLVDRLLDSTAYGEHWARLWLDIVRYGDSNGFDWDEFRPMAWRFRDYVIRAFNDDKPFDRFVREQLAGDEMLQGEPQNETDQQCLIAAGFLRAGPFDNSARQFGEYLQCRTQVMSDIVETTGSAFLGINLSCCRCHNHKLDPFSQADYYRMRAFFEGVQSRDDLPLDLAPQQEAIRKHNAVLDEQLNERRKAREAIVDPVSDRLQRGHIAKLADYDQKLLQQSRETAPPEVREQIRKLERFVSPKDAEVEAALTGDERTRRDAINREIAEIEKQRRPFTLGLLATDDGVHPQETRVLSQGECTQPREAVAPGFFSVFDPNPAEVAAPARKNSSGRRTALAEWIVSPDNPLTARVLVNRLWQAHFGDGLVATPNDFGFAGARPTHPELLDWLAREFMNEGWSLKYLHRLLVTSNTYRQGLGDGSSEARRWLAGRQPARLDAEELRDSMLQVAGCLQTHQGGPPLWPKLPADVEKSYPSLLDYEAPLKQWQHSPEEETHVRSIYLVQKRSVRLPLMETFDLPENACSCPKRVVSIVAPQALALLNNEFSVDTAKAFARRITREAGTDLEPRIDRAFILALQRLPDIAEREECETFVRRHGFTELCRALLNLNEFAYVD